MTRQAQKTFRNALALGYQLLWYRVDGVLGQGAFGITYLAHDINLDRQVAIKEFLPSGLAARGEDQTVHTLSDDHSVEYKLGLDRFLKEARTLARFEHPNVVRVLNVFEANNTAYMVMNYEQGETLREVLGRRHSVPEAELKGLLVPLLDGLEHIHAAGFIHRDIKPANLFIRADGSPVLIDFGAARQALMEHTQTITNFVSKGYAAIEQYTSKGDKQGPWTDVYGLGATLYRSITGNFPPDAVERSEAISHGNSDLLARLTEIAAGRYPQTFLKAVDHALAFRAQDRPQTIAAWRLEFENGAAAAPPEVPTQVMPPREEVKTMVMPRIDHDAPTDVVAPAASHVQSHHRRAAGPRVLAVAGLLGAIILTWGLYSLLSGEPEAPETATDEAVPPATDSPPLWLEITPAPPEAGGTPQTGVADEPFPEQLSVEGATAFTPQQENGGQIESLLAEAHADIAALRLTTPKGNSAFDKYMTVLALDPQNAEAQRGVAAIAHKYVELVYRDLEANKLDRAGTYLAKAEELAPAAQAVKDARAALEARKAAPTAEAKSAETESFKDKMDEFKQKFDDFVKEQPPAQKTRADDLRDRLGGGH